MTTKPLTLTVLFSNCSDRSSAWATIQGKRSDYRDLIGLLRSGNDFTRTLVPVDGAILRGYDGVLTKIVATIGPDDLLLSVDGDTLVLNGNTESFEVFAENIDFVANPATAPTLPIHLHFEYYDGRPYLRESSLPLVVEVSI